MTHLHKKEYSKDWCQGFCTKCGTACAEHCEEIATANKTIIEREAEWEAICNERHEADILRAQLSEARKENERLRAVLREVRSSCKVGHRGLIDGAIAPQGEKEST